MFEQFGNSIKASLYDKVSSPLSGAFIISWCIYNYKILIIILSSLSPSDKIYEVSVIAYQDSLKFWDVTLYYFFSSGFIFPLVSAIIFLFLYPYPSKLMYKYWASKQEELKSLKLEIENVSPMHPDTAISLRRNALSLSMKFDEELAVKEKEILRLKEQITLESEGNISRMEEVGQLNDHIASLTNDLKNTKDELTVIKKSKPETTNQMVKEDVLTQYSDFQKALIRSLSNSDGYSMDKGIVKDLASKFELKPIIFGEQLNELMTRKHLFERAGQLILSAAGKTFSVKNNLH